MSIESIRALKTAALEPKVKKKYSIPKISPKRAKRMLADKATFEADKEFYIQIWAASPHKCQCSCNAKLGKEPLTTFFHHLLFKAQYPELRHVPENIMILHPDCHNAYHSNPLNRPEVSRRQEAVLKLYEDGKLTQEE